MLIVCDTFKEKRFRPCKNVYPRGTNMLGDSSVKYRPQIKQYEHVQIFYFVQRVKQSLTSEYNFDLLIFQQLCVNCRCCILTTAQRLALIHNTNFYDNVCFVKIN